jgi:hypothetical protein
MDICLAAARIARAAWRLERAERIEAGLFEHHLPGDRNLGLALIRDGNDPGRSTPCCAIAARRSPNCGSCCAC